MPLSKTGAELLFELISQRYGRGATLITSNLPFDEWTETLGSERLTGALLDRITHHVNILEMNGESYRLAQSRARKAGWKPLTKIADAASGNSWSGYALPSLACAAKWPTFTPPCGRICSAVDNPCLRSPSRNCLPRRECELYCSPSFSDGRQSTGSA